MMSIDEDFNEYGKAVVVSKEAAARLKAIKAAAEKLRAERKLATRRRIEELKQERLDE